MGQAEQMYETVEGIHEKLNVSETDRETENEYEEGATPSVLSKVCGKPQKLLTGEASLKEFLANVKEDFTELPQDFPVDVALNLGLTLAQYLTGTPVKLICERLLAFLKVMKDAQEFFVQFVASWRRSCSRRLWSSRN